MRRFKILQTLFLLSASISSAGTLTENAEEESPAVTAAIDSSYSHVQTEVAPQGNKAFFLTHTGADQSDQTITLDSSFTATANTKLYFESRLNWATSTQIAYAEVKESGSTSWVSVWTQSGTNSAGSSFFSLEETSLSSYAGKTLSLRFRYVASGSYYPSDSIGVGWIFDNIQVGESFTTREWSIGEPTAKEQLVTELINRARADSQADLQRLKETTDTDVLHAYDYFSVDLDILTSQFAGSNFGPGAQASGDTNAIATTLPPLAPNYKLLAASRLHTQDMFNNQFQGHGSSSGALSPNQEADQVGDRIQRQGYTYSTTAENVSSYSSSIWDSHAAFIVDWGTSASTGLTYGGMQDPAGHRNNVYGSGFREIGVGVVEGTNGNVGPILVTHAMATSSDYNQPFITGVAYYDTDGDGFYDEGEGIGGITVKVDGSPYHAITPDSGGYAIPMVADGDYEVNYTMPDGSSDTENVTISNQQNVKSDITPRWQATTLSGPETYETNSQVSYVLTANPAATAYKLYLWEIVAGTGTIGAESTGEVIASASSSYDVRQIATVNNGSYAYRILSTDGQDQTLELDYDLLPGTSATLQWQDRLGILSSTQDAEVQISTDSGTTWSTINSRKGSGYNSYATAFTQQSISLAGYEDMPLRIRFRIYNPPTSSFFSSMSDNFGWYIDDITFSNVEVLVEGITSEGTSPQWTFSSPDSAIFLLRAQIINNTNTYPIGPGLRIQAVDAATATQETALVGTLVSNNWYSSSWMDYYFASTTTGNYWFYHYTLGWLYFGGVSGNGAWYYDSALGWLWTTSSEYPLFYQSNGSKWLYYNKGSLNPRYFYDTSTNIWSEN